jgi:hypothetical protein
MPAKVCENTGHRNPLARVISPFPKIGDVGFSSGGPLTPGAYSFTFIYDLVGGSGSGEIQLTLSHHHGGNHVPDAGSTLTLLGVAFGALGLIRHRI